MRMNAEMREQVAEYNAARSRALSKIAEEKRRKRLGIKKSNKPKKERVKINYFEYIKSAAWRERREMALKFHNGKCNRCGSRFRLHVHHKNYKRVGREKMADLEVLCGDCHALEHEGIVGAVDSLSLEFRDICG